MERLEERMTGNDIDYIQMGERKLTVYYGRGGFKKSPPQILLQGKWLEQAGFSKGDKITVKYRQGQLIITKDEPEPDIGKGI